MIIFLIINILLLFFYSILFVFYRLRFQKVNSFVPGSEPIQALNQPLISIIIPARNEEKNIAALLQSIQQQTYPAENFEVIVVDDFSTDNTVYTVAKFPFVKLISLQNVAGIQQINSYKKKAIETGITQCRGELIVTTDADCTVPEKWLETIAAFYAQHQPEFMVLPVAINCSNRFIEIFQALDFMSMQGITATMVYHMCNGANLAYTKKAFLEVNGFSGIDHIASGDDMLLMQKITTRFPGKIKYIKSKDVIVQTAPVKTVKEFFQQRIRWASKTGDYRDKWIFLTLLLVYVFNAALLIFAIAALVTGKTDFFIYWLLIIAVKTIVELIFLFPVARFFDKQKLLWCFPIAQPLHILYIVIAGWLGKFGTYKWKDRRVK